VEDIFSSFPFFFYFFSPLSSPLRVGGGDGRRKVSEGVGKERKAFSPFPSSPLFPFYLFFPFPSLFSCTQGMLPWMAKVGKGKIGKISSEQKISLFFPFFFLPSPSHFLLFPSTPSDIDAITWSQTAISSPFPFSFFFLLPSLFSPPSPTAHRQGRRGRRGHSGHCPFSFFLFSPLFFFSPPSARRHRLIKRD